MSTTCECALKAFNPEGGKGAWHKTINVYKSFLMKQFVRILMKTKHDKDVKTTNNEGKKDMNENHVV